MAELSGHQLAERMAGLARSVAAPRNLEDVLAGVTAAAIELLPGAGTAGVLLIAKGDKFESLFGTSDLIYKLDALQEKYGEGPCVDAAVDEMNARTDDFETEQRWPEYSRPSVRPVCAVACHSSSTPAIRPRAR